MRILSIVPVRHSGGGRFPAVARFDFEATSALRMFNWTLRTTPDGGNIVLPPNALGRRVAGFNREFANQVTAAAIAALAELSPDVRRST